MAANRRTVGPKAGGGWPVTGGSAAGAFGTQAEAERAARQELLPSGSGELVVKGRDGKKPEHYRYARSPAYEGLTV
jgi:hypothetical protein